MKTLNNLFQTYFTLWKVIIKPNKVKLEWKYIFECVIRTVGGYIPQASPELTIFMRLPPWVLGLQASITTPGPMGSFKLKGLDWFSDTIYVWSLGIAPHSPRDPQGPLPAQQYEGHCCVAFTAQPTSHRWTLEAKPGPFLSGRKSIVLQDRSPGSGNSKPWLRDCCAWSLQRRQTPAQTRLCSSTSWWLCLLWGFSKQ